MVKHFGKQLIKLCDNKKVSCINDIDKWSPKLFLEKRFVSSAIFFFHLFKQLLFIQLHHTTGDRDNNNEIETKQI